MRKHLFVCLILCFLVLPFFSLAHSSGQTIEKNINGYIVDIGYDSIDVNPIAGEPVRYDFKLFKGEKKDSVEFSNMWFKASLGNVPMIAGRLAKEELIPTGLLMTFPQGGEYEVTVRFSDKDNTLVEINFPVTVSKAAYEIVLEQNVTKKWVSLGLSLFVIAGFGYFLGRFGKKKK